MFKNKKGALELSITAIVVLIIAITVLSFAIMFIKGMFQEAGEIFPEQFAKIKEQLRKDLEETGELVVLSSGTELEVKRGEEFNFHIGVRNPADTGCFRIAIECKTPFTTDEFCTDSDAGEGAIVGGRTDLDDQPAEGENWFPRLLSEFTVRGGEIEVSPATLQVARARPDTYLMELQVFKGDADCSSWASPTTRSFHIVIN